MSRLLHRLRLNLSPSSVQTGFVETQSSAPTATTTNGKCSLRLSDLSRNLILTARKGKTNGQQSARRGSNVWRKAPVLKGTTKFEPNPEIRNIMVTGGAGFMFVPHERLRKLGL